VRRLQICNVKQLKCKLRSRQKSLCAERRELDVIIAKATESRDKCVAAYLQLQQALIELDGVR
jgi:hypothetical protein